jgi:hypothetical protein
VRIVDVASVTLEQTALAPAFIGPLGWLTRRVLVGLLEDNTPLVFDTATGAVVRRPAPLRSCTGTHPTAAAGKRLLALEPGGLAAIADTGTVRRTAIPWVPRQCFRAAIAVDARGGSAWVAAGRHLARLELPSMRVTAPALAGSGLGRASGRLSMTAVGGGLVVAHQSIGGLPRGVEFVDTRARTRKTLARPAGAARAADGLVLTYNGATRRRGRPDGVRAFDGRGRLRYRVLRGRWIEDLVVAGSRAYAIGAGWIWTIDARSGRVLARSSSNPKVTIDLLEP